MARVSAGTAQVVAIAVAVAAGVGLAVTGHSSSASATVRYSTAAATVTTVTDQISATGTVQSASTLDLAFGSSGLAVTGVEVHAGQAVQAGQVLATVDHTAATAALASAEAQLAVAEAQAAAATAVPTASPSPTVRAAATTTLCTPAAATASPQASPSPSPTASASPTPSAGSGGPTGGRGSGGRPGGGRPGPTPTASPTPTATATPTPSPTGSVSALATATASTSATAAKGSSGCAPTPSGTAGRSQPTSGGSTSGGSSSGAPTGGGSTGGGSTGGATSLVSAQQQVSQAQAALDATTLTAPQAGVVESVNLVVGTLPGSPAVVLRASGFQVLVDVAEQDAPFVRVGQTGQATLSALGVSSGVTVVQGPISGTQASSTAGASVVSFPVLLALPSPPPGLLPGMSAQVAWTAATRTSVLAVPTTAIRSGDTGDVVVAMVDGRPQTEPVTVGLSTASLTQVEAGLQPGERVVTGLAG